MTAVDEIILGPIESVTGMLGLRTPGMRAIAVGAAVGGVLMLTKPTLMFTDGEARPWGIIDGSAKNGTPITWWVASIAAGGMVYYLV